MSGHRNKNSMNGSLKEKLEDFKEWISEHTKVVMPIVLILCVGVTVAIALNANKKSADEEAKMAGAAETLSEIEAIPEAEEAPLELNVHPEVNELISSYYDALLAKDSEKVKELNPYIIDKDLIYALELSKYVESYPKLDVYTKPGPVDGSYMVYLYTEMKFLEYDGLAPGLEPFYVCPDENGKLIINYKAKYENESPTVMEYIQMISQSEDVKDLYNQVKAQYSDTMAADQDFSAFVEDLKARINVSTGELLAQAEAPVKTEDTQTEEAAETDANTPDAAAEPAAQEPAAAVTKVKAKEVVNIRSSDSETADKLGKAQAGDEFPLLEQKGNGWSKITFEGKDAYVKTDFLEPVTEELASNTADTENTVNTETADTDTAAGNDQQAAAAEEPAVDVPTGDGKTVVVQESVNVRKSASETGEKLGLVYVGEKLEVIMKQADGWTKVKYKGETGYVKSEYVK